MELQIESNLDMLDHLPTLHQVIDPENQKFAA